MAANDSGFSLLFEEQNREVGRKLGIATFAMFSLPLITFFIAMEVFANKQDPTMWAGGVSILVVNIVIATYVISAFSEPDDDLNDRVKNDPNDEAGPRVGAFKQRTD
mmetsp:Transcript_14617/g.20664  ORF Transcript_14617/g.20664 Transcript_14617/m.20664 type:complete len:107 (-) Transcript_14617:216-536(-)